MLSMRSECFAFCSSDLETIVVVTVIAKLLFYDRYLTHISLPLWRSWNAPFYIHTDTQTKFFDFFSVCVCTECQNAYKKLCFKKYAHTDVQGLRLMEVSLKTGDKIQRWFTAALARTMTPGTRRCSRSRRDVQLVTVEGQTNTVLVSFSHIPMKRVLQWAQLCFEKERDSNSDYVWLYFCVQYGKKL